MEVLASTDHHNGQAPNLKILAMSFFSKLPVGPHEATKAHMSDITIMIMNYVHGKKKKSGIWVNTIY